MSEKNKHEGMATAGKRTDTADTKRYLKEQTGSPEAQPAAAGEFMGLLKRL